MKREGEEPHLIILIIIKSKRFISLKTLSCVKDRKSSLCDVVNMQAVREIPPSEMASSCGGIKKVFTHNHQQVETYTHKMQKWNIQTPRYTLLLDLAGMYIRFILFADYLRKKKKSQF